VYSGSGVYKAGCVLHRAGSGAWLGRQATLAGCYVGCGMGVTGAVQCWREGVQAGWVRVAGIVSSVLLFSL
jgi:hypothetical protein